MLDDHTLLAQAAVETYRQLEADVRRASPRIGRLLRRWRAHLFDLRFNVKRLLLLCEIRDHSISTEFRRELGVPPREYLEACRLETARRLLEEGSLGVSRVAELVGYRWPTVFTAAFQRRFGVSPSAVRRRGHEAPVVPGRRPEAKGSRLPRFVAGVATLEPADRCYRCGVPLEPGLGPRAFETGEPLCDGCSLAHAPPFVVQALLTATWERFEAERRPGHLAQVADPETLVRGLRGRLSHAEAEAVMGALCQLYPFATDALVEQQWLERFERELEVAQAGRIDAGSAEEVVGVLNSVLQAGEVEKLRASELWRVLEGLPLEAGRHVIEAVEPRFKTPALVQRLLFESQTLLGEVPQRARQLAELAGAALAALDPELLGEAAFEDLRAEVWARLANARRVACDLRGADHAFEQALAHLDRGSGTLRHKAEVLDLLGSLRRDQRRFGEALVCFDRALAVYRVYLDAPAVAKVLINKANVYHQASEPELGVPLLQRALGLIEPEATPRLWLAASHNLADCLCESGRCAEAATLLAQLSKHYEESGTATDKVRLVWLRGKIALSMGQVSEAEHWFREAQQGFASLDDSIGAAAMPQELAGVAERSALPT